MLSWLDDSTHRSLAFGGRVARRIMVLAGAAALAGAVACGGDDDGGTGPDDDIEGNYELVGASSGQGVEELPVQVTVGQDRIQIAEGSMVLQSDGDYEIDIPVTLQTGGTGSINSQGTYEVEDEDISFEPESGSVENSFTGEVDDDQIAVQIVSGFFLIFERD